MIAEGRVAVNGTILDTPATVLSSLDGVTDDGNPVERIEAPRLFLFHKPAGFLTAARDPAGRPTIYDRLPKDLPRLMPVGRLDLATEGLLLMTNDGGLKRLLELPATGVERAYRARAYGHVTQPMLESLIDGIEIEGVRYGPIDANIERRTGANVWIEMVLREGKNREVRRVLEHLGLQVGRLIRTRYGPFLLGDLPVGGIGEVAGSDLGAFRQTLTRGVTGGTTLPELKVDAIVPAAPRIEPRPARTPPRPAQARPVQSRPAQIRPEKGNSFEERPAKASRPLRPKPATAPRRAETADPAAQAPARPVRPARPPQRKAGWAKPKPKPQRGGPKGRR